MLDLKNRPMSRNTIFRHDPIRLQMANLQNSPTHFLYWLALFRRHYALTFVDFQKVYQGHGLHFFPQRRLSKANVEIYKRFPHISALALAVSNTLNVII